MRRFEYSATGCHKSICEPLLGGFGISPIFALLAPCEHAESPNIFPIGSLRVPGSGSWVWVWVCGPGSPGPARPPYVGSYGANLQLRNRWVHAIPQYNDDHTFARPSEAAQA